jgi:hypothetical protein
MKPFSSSSSDLDAPENIDEPIKQKITDQTPSYELVVAKNMFTFDPKDYRQDELMFLNEGMKKLKKIS